MRRLIGNLAAAVGAVPTVVAPPTQAPDIIVPFTSRRNASMSASQDTQRLLSIGWSAPENLSESPGRSARPVTVVGVDGSVHVVWEEEDRLFHTVRTDGVWSSPQEVATGQQAAAVLDASGALHLTFANEFAEKFNVYYAVWRAGEWSLPRLVSRTTGMSVYPSIALDGHGVPHIAWADRTPGYFIIYHGWLDRTWLYEPLTDARGIAPVLVHDAHNGVMHIAWQAQVIDSESYEVFHTQGTTYQWVAPENISASPAQSASAVAMACDEQGTTHLVWQSQDESRSQIFYSGGGVGHWTVPEAISGDGVAAADPAVVVTHGNQLSAVWREDNIMIYRRRSGADGAWRPSKPLVVNDGGLEKLSLAAAVDGSFHLTWSAWAESAERDVFHSTGEPVFAHQVFVPSVPISP